MEATTREKQAAPKPETKRRKRRRFVGFSEQLEIKRQARARRTGPRPWLERKFVVGVVIAIVGYAWYVYVGRFCVPMIRRDKGALGERGMGIAFLAVFCLLGLMFWWSYIKLILTPPGFAKDHVQKTPVPQYDPRRPQGRPPPSASRSHDAHEDGSNDSVDDSDSDFWDTEDDGVGGPPYNEAPPSTGSGSRAPAKKAPQPQPQPTRDLEKDSHQTSTSLYRPEASTSHDAARTRKPSTSRHKSHSARRRANSEVQDTSAGVVDSIPAVASARARAFSDPKLTPLPPKDPPAPLPPAHTKNTSQSARHAAEGGTGTGAGNADGNANRENGRGADDGLPPTRNSRRPPSHPVLSPEYRYCYRDGFVKPMRAHHCRSCGTCVLMYDHHCPWIGQCVGARNHKFFVNFLQWSTPWTLWILATLVGLVAKKSSDPGFSIDAQLIVIIALSGFFSLFTITLLLAHIRLIVLNQSSVESLQQHSMQAREQDILSSQVPLCAWRKRNKIRKEWDDDWGKLGTEDNLWWLGSWRANWKYRMGKNPRGWFLPVGRSEGDGLTYPTNPRFDADGRWRRRSEWPPELR